jgi:hypothetical protein
MERPRMIHRFSSTDTEGTRIASSNLGSRSDMESMHPLIQVHDTSSADHGLSGSVSAEIISICGAEVLVYVRAESESYDDVYDEEPDPVYKRPKRLKAFFPPQPIAAQLGPWGIDVENKATVVFSKEQVFRDFGGRMIKIGDVIELPYNGSGIRLDRFRVLNAFDFGNFRYNWLYWSCQCENLTNDITVEPD